MLGALISVELVIILFFSIRYHGTFSFITAGAVGFAIYHIPSVVGLAYPFHLGTGSRETRLMPVLQETASVTIVAGVALLLVILLTRNVNTRNLSKTAPNALRPSLLLSTVALLFIAGYAFISLQEGPLFFLNSRDMQETNIIKLMWRWVAPLGLILAAKTRHWGFATFFFAGIVVYFISGDRTMFTITAVALIIANPLRASSLAMIFKPLYITILLIAATIAIFGKSIYLSAKAFSLTPLLFALSPEGLELKIKAFEPFSTYNITDLIVRYDFSMPAGVFLEGLAGQFLLVPSYFGIDSNAFNTLFTNEFVPFLTYGIAGNYWGQAYAVGGYAFVFFFGLVYMALLKVSDVFLKRGKMLTQLGAAMFGALVAIYAHRNSLENILAFARQLFLVLVTIYVVSYVFSAGRKLE